ncbi:hypothetical protein CP532_2651 [Ophiocordyceps camponoti-leonardi (nom. inval.)]|nr:hypothetical protein CP532_2651 [Ophiocordyceps camponoti-leonardi (nom. inval.)]
MYQRPATASSGVQAPRPGGSFYYDYTEEFEKPAPLIPRTEFQAPLCPVPQRAGDGSRHMVLREDLQARLDAISSGRARAHVAATRTDQCLPTPADGPRAETHEEHDLGHSEDKILAGSGRPAIAVASDNGPAASAAKDSVSEPRVAGDAEALASPPTLECAQDDERLRPGRGVWLLPKPFAAEAHFPQNERSSLIKARNTLDPTLSEFASLFSSFDRLAKSPFSHGDGETSTTRVVYCPPSNMDDLDNDYVDSDDQVDCGGDDEKNEQDDQVGLGVFPKRLRSRPSLQLFNELTAEDQARNRRHRRNGAALRINTAGLGDVGGSRQQLSPPKEELTIICPEPISPARQLKVTRSVPQLMKALPPLPGEATGTSGREGTRGHQTGKRSEDTRVCDGLSDEACVPLSWNAPETSPPKLKLRVKAASSSGAVSDLKTAFGSGDGEGHWNGNAAVKPRLKIKVSRSRLGQANRLKQCNSLADLAVRRQEVDAEAGSEAEAEAHAGAALSGAFSGAHEDGGRKSLAGWESREGDSSGSDQFNIAYPPCADKSELLQRRSSLPSKDAARSFTWEVERRGLRQKLSMFRLRLTGGPTKEAEDSKAATDAAAAAATTEGSDQARGRAISSTRSERVGGRVRRWASDAKQAVRLYVRRRLDRSSRMSG